MEGDWEGWNKEVFMKTENTKIVCTIGPASNSKKILRKLIKAGMNVARLNFSHGSHKQHEKVIRFVRDLSQELNKPVAILQDLQGPKIRIGELLGGHVELKKNEKWTITTRNVKGRQGLISTTYRQIVNDLNAGDRILIDDGLLELRVLSKDKTHLYCKVITGGLLGEHKGINLPGVRTSIPSLTKKDKADLEVGIKAGVDYVALSFVRSVKDVLVLKRFLKRRGVDIPVIAKIEKPEALVELEDILDACEGIMVARGDLGVEVSPEKVPMAQKRMIRMANEKRRLVITATQMLESMTDHPRPTRAEASDVANAILDGTDAVMLSAETSVGKYPVESVRMMKKISRETETDLPSKPYSGHRPTNFPDAISEAACFSAESLGLKAIVAFSQSGFTAALISKHRPPVPIIACTPDEKVQRRLALYWGVSAMVVPHLSGTDKMVETVESLLLERRFARKGDKVAILAGTPLMIKGTTNMIKLHVVQ